MKSNTASALLEKALKLKAEKTGLPYTIEKAGELLGQKTSKKCECGAPAVDVYCQNCIDMYSDRAETERNIERMEVMMGGER